MSTQSPSSETSPSDPAAGASEKRAPRLFPSQVCFVVDDVPAAVEDCVARFGWGPFQQFTAPVEEAEYRGWTGRKVTDVGLGMAGHVQVELIHVHEGHDAVEAYQARYGKGFQHLGVGCRSRDEAMAHLASLGAELNSQTDFEGLRIAFVDIPTGPAMFELLETPRDQPAKKDKGKSAKSSGPDLKEQTKGSGDRAPVAPDPNLFAIDRATIVTRDLDSTLDFYRRAFRWEDPIASEATLQHPDGASRFKRCLGRAGTLELELLEPTPGATDPYARHLERGDHGLVHAGGPEIAQNGTGNDAGSWDYRWLETDEAFRLEAWAGGERALQRRAR